MQSGECVVPLTIDSSSIAQGLAMISQGVTLQGALKTGAQEQRSHEVSWAMYMHTVTEQNQAIKDRPARGGEGPEVVD